MEAATLVASNYTPIRRGRQSHNRTKSLMYTKWINIPKERLCLAWRHSFVNFYNHMGEPPSEYHHLARHNQSLPHSPENTYWKHSGIYVLPDGTEIHLKHDGEYVTLRELAAIFNISEVTLRDRLIAKWPLEEACTTPANQRRKDGRTPRPKTHGMTDTTEYRIWVRQRYNNQLCVEWHNDFMVFYKAVGNRPSREHNLIRPDKTRLYGPDNFMWNKKSEMNRRLWKTHSNMKGLR